MFSRALETGVGQGAAAIHASRQMAHVGAHAAQRQRKDRPSAAQTLVSAEYSARLARSERGNAAADGARHKLMSAENNGRQDEIASLAEQIRALIQEKLLADPGSPTEDLVATGVVDSLSLIQLLVHVEERFAVTIPLTELELDDIRSVTSLAHLIANRKTRYAAMGERNGV